MIRPSVITLEVQAQVTKLTDALLRKMKPQGPGSFEFSMIQGNLHWLDMESNNMTIMHYAKLFGEIYVPGKIICVWNSHPSADVDVWTFWSRMLARGLAFEPTSAKSKKFGVFLILFLKTSSTTGHNGQATFITICEAHDEVQELKERPEEGPREAPAPEMRMEPQSLDSGRRRIYLMAASRSDPSYKGKFQVASRIIPCLRPSMDLVILPSDSKAVNDYWELAQNCFDLERDQAIVSNWNTDDCIDESALTQIKAHIIGSPQDKSALVPYVMSPGIERVAAALAEFCVVVLGEESEWIAKYGTRRMLHLHARSPGESSIFESDVGPGFAVPGYVCVRQWIAHPSFQ